MGKLPHFSIENSCYFLTSTTNERKPLFRNDKYVQILCNIIYNLRNKGKMSLLGFVIMPEHFHLLIVPSSGTKISWIMQEIKKGSARLINKDRFGRARGRARLPNLSCPRPCHVFTPFLSFPCRWGAKKSQKEISGKPFSCHPEFISGSRNSLIL